METKDVFFPPDIDYPVSLAIYHSAVNGSDTPVSGDMIHFKGEDLKAYRELQRGN